MEPSRTIGGLDRAGTAVLIAATVLAALAITLDGTISRLFNGMAGGSWFVAAALLVVAARPTASWRLWASAIGLTAVVAFVVTPSDFLPAIIGFGAAGCLLALIAGQHEFLWSRVLVGLYLPLHVGTAIVRALWRMATDGEASIRTEPPPTAALVPITMLLAATAGAAIVVWWRRRAQGNATRPVEQNVA